MKIFQNYFLWKKMFFCDVIFEHNTSKIKKDMFTRDTFKIYMRSKSTHVQNPPDQYPAILIREPLTNRE